MKILKILQNLDRRLLYLLIAAVVILPLITRPSRHAKTVFPEVNKTYETLNNVHSDKLIIISSVWSPSTAGENAPQMEAIVRHLFLKGKKFLVISWDQEGEFVSYQLCKKIETEYKKVYGKDWAHAGFKPPPIFTVISGMAKDFQKVMNRDRFGTKLKELPVTSFVKDSNQIGAVVEITPSATIDTWIAYFCMPHKVPLIYCPTAVMAAEAFPYLDSGQVSGMLNGVIGASQYETLIGLQNTKTDAVASAYALSYAHIFIILLIIIGNTAYAIQKNMVKKEGNKGG